MKRLTRPSVAIVILLVLLVVSWQYFRSSVVPATFARPTRIAFFTDRGGDWEIYVMERDGSNLTNLTNDEAQDGLPAWSYQANAFAFITTRVAGGMSLYRMDADGGNPLALSVDPPADAGSPIWSPTGEWIAFDSGGDAAADVYLVDHSGENVHNLTQDAAHDSFDAWSPDGQQLLFTSDRGGSLSIYAIGVQEGAPVRLTDPDSASAAPDWSPDGTRIAFMSDRDGDIEIYVMDADGADVTRLTDSEGFDGYPVWSPDGSRIAFLSARDGNAEIYVMNADGSEPMNLTNSPSQESLEGDFAWSPDGTQILFHSDQDGDVEVYVMNADGSHQVNLTNHPASDFGSIWVP